MGPKTESLEAHTPCVVAVVVVVVAWLAWETLSPLFLLYAHGCFACMYDCALFMKSAGGARSQIFWDWRQL